MKYFLPITVLAASVVFAGCSPATPPATAASKPSTQASAPAINVTLPPLSPNELGMWLMEYYVHPDPDLLIPRSAQLCVLAASNGQSVKPTVVFVSEVIRAEPSRVDGWADEIPKQTGGRTALCEGLWMSGSAQALVALKRIHPRLTETEQAAVTQLLKTTPVTVRQTPILANDMETTMTNMDANWAAYFATGASWPVDRLYTLLVVDRSALSPADFLTTKKIALWSLGSIAQAHPTLAEHARARLSTLPTDVRVQVEASLASGGQSAGNAPEGTLEAK